MIIPEDDTARPGNTTDKVASKGNKPMAKDNQDDYVDVVLVCEVEKDEDSGNAFEEKADHSSFFGFETKLLQYNLKELISKDNQQLSKSQSNARDHSDEMGIPDLQESDSEDILSATRSFGLFSFSSGKSGLRAPTLSEFSSFEIYELEGSPYCCEELPAKSFEEDDYDETKHVQDNRRPLQAFTRVASFMLGRLSHAEYALI